MYLMGLRLALFWRKASKVFPILLFDFPVPAKDEMGEPESDGEDDLGVSSAALSYAFLPSDPIVEAAHTSSSDT